MGLERLYSTMKNKENSLRPKREKYEIENKLEEQDSHQKWQSRGAWVA